MPAKSKLSITNEEQICSNCIHAKKLPLRKEMLCAKKGVVPASYKCHNYSIDITTIAMPRRHLSSFDKLNADDFSIK